MKRLIEALENDNLVKLRKLLEEGADLSRLVVVGEEYEMDEPEEIGILFFAIRRFVSLEAIKLLSEYGLDIKMRDAHGVSALDTAIKFKRVDVIEFCLDEGFDVNGSSRKSGITPLMLASCFGDRTIVELLLSKGADINAKDKSGMSPTDYARKLGQKRMQEFLIEQGGQFGIYS